MVQVDRRSGSVYADGVRAKFGVDPEFISDYLALVGDSADGYPGIKGIGAKGAATLIARMAVIATLPAKRWARNARRLYSFKLSRAAPNQCAAVRQHRRTAVALAPSPDLHR